MSESIQIEEQVLVGRNSHGYTFAVGRISDRWLGYALGGGGMFIFPEISENHDLGLPDMNDAIRRVSALAQDPERGYGGIEQWYIAESLRADPDQFRCSNCGEVCCDGECDLDDRPDDDRDEDDPHPEEAAEDYDFGPCCCCCRANVRTRNLVMMDRRAPVPGSGWGCLTCGLPMDGAMYVACDDCAANKTPPVEACLGLPLDKKRLAIALLGEDRFEHEMSKHPEERS
jgi:hypothetical protein